MPNNRIVILGTSASGKTTLAQKIAAKKCIPHFQLDVLFWKPGWTETPRKEFHDKIKQAIATNNSWVICGNYNSAKQITLPVATDIIWLNYPLYKNLWRGLKRSVQRILSDGEPFAGCKETFRLTFLSKDSILLWILNSHKRRITEYTPLLTNTNFPEAKIWVVKTEADYERLLANI